MKKTLAIQRNNGLTIPENGCLLVNHRNHHFAQPVEVTAFPVKFSQCQPFVKSLNVIVFGFNNVFPLFVYEPPLSVLFNRSVPVVEWIRVIVHRFDHQIFILVNVSIPSFYFDYPKSFFIQKNPFPIVINFIGVWDILIFGNLRAWLR